MSGYDTLKTHLEALRAAKRIRNQLRCLQILSLINDYFEMPRSSNEIKYAVELLLKESEKKIDIVKLLITAITVKNLDECGSKALEIIQKVIILYSSFVKPFSKNVIDVCIQIIKCPEPKARFKEMAVKTIDELIVRDALRDEEKDTKIGILIKTLLSVFDQPVKNRFFQNTFELLGRISKTFPESFTQENAKKLMDKALSVIQNLFRDDKSSVSLILISGAVDSLKNHLENFTPKETENACFNKRLYECMLLMSNPFKHSHINTESNRVAFRHMLSVVSIYGHLVGEYIFEDHFKWHNIMLQWISSKNYEDKNAGVYAIQTVHAEIGKHLEKHLDDNKKEILLFYMSYFQKTLESPQSQPHEIRIAIKGFGSMAAAAKVLLEPKYLNERFDLVMQRTEYSYFVGNKMKRREVLEHLPTYIESLSKIIYQIDEISGIQLQSLQSIIVILIKDFHFLSTSHHNLVAVGLLETFCNLEKMGGRVFTDTIESVTWQGILWTCSHQLVYDLENNYENIKDWKETITYKRYLPLWKCILIPSNTKYKQISAIIYEYFIKNLFEIIHKLNLSTRKRKYFDESTNTEVEFFFTDPSLDLEAVRPENFQVLYNLTQFYSDILSQQTKEDLNEYFIEWLEFWSERSIALAIDNPLVSAFMSLNEIAFKVMDRTEFVQRRINEDVKFLESKLFETLSSYVKLLLIRAKHVSDELQIACLNLIFLSPIAILKESIEETISVFKIGFNVGRNIVNLANRALTCFENIVNEYNNDSRMRRRLLEEILPYFETFLSSGKELASGNELKELKYKRQKKKTIIQTIDTDLMKLKKRILLFLGTCTPEESQLILSNLDQKLTQEYVLNIFKVTLHSNDDLFPLIHLDPIIDRVCHISLHSSDRATRISGCELLHGMILYMMGKNLKESETLFIWKNMCKNIIILGAEKDQTIRALFEPLLMQMMHYYSKPDQILSPLSTALMETVLQMISYHENSVQDLSARLLREYILWLMRQTSVEQRKLAPITLVDFFQELKKMSIDTEESRRMGATLAFNNVYRIIREEESLIDIYWIYLLDVFCMNFKNTEDLSDQFDSNFGDSRRFEQIHASLDHLVRVFNERKDIFQQSNYDRIRPNGFEGVILEDVLKWLFEQCTMPQYFYRRKCMDIFLKMSEDEGKKSFYEKNFSIEKLIQICDERVGLITRPDLEFLKETTGPIYKETYNWMKSFLCLLDFYTWLFKMQLFSKTYAETLLSSSVVYNSIEYFLKNVVLNDINDVIRSIDQKILNTTQMSCEAKMYNRNLKNINIMRSTIIFAILDFFNVLMKQFQIYTFFEKNQLLLSTFIIDLTFESKTIANDLKYQFISKDIYDHIVEFLQVSSNHTSKIYRKLMKKLENQIILKIKNMTQSCKEIFSSSNIDEIEENRLKAINVLITNFQNDMNKKQLHITGKNLLNIIFEETCEKNMEITRPRYFKPQIKKFATSMLKICLKVSNFLEELLLFILDDTPLKMTDSCTIEKGENFLIIFKNTIFQVFVENVQNTVNFMISQLSESTLKNLRIFNILSDLNEFAYKFYSDKLDVLDSCVHAMISIWPTIMKAASNMPNNLNSVDMAMINLSTRIAMICPYELHLLGQRLENFQKWLLDIFESKENSLEIKSKGISLLPCITHSDDKNNEELSRALNKIRQYHIPFRSLEFPEGSVQRSSFVVFTKSIFQALLTSRSPTVYKFIIHITINDDKYLLEEKLQTIQKDLMKSLTEKEQAIFLAQTFEIFLDEQFDPEIRLSIVSRYLLIIMKNCRIEAIMAFFRQKIGQIWQLIDANFDFDPASAFASRSGGYMIIEAFAATVPKDKIENSTFSYGGVLNNGLTFIKEFIMKAKDVRRDVVFVVDDLKLQEIFRKFQCYCYRALATVVANTKDLIEVYNLCLFQENQRTRSFIWRKLINILDENIYSNFSQDFDDFPRVKEYMVSIKEMNVSSKHQQYIEKTSIFDRSLSQTLTKTDLSYSVLISNREMLENDQKRNAEQQQMSINLESIPINDHEVMSILIAVINSIHSRKLSIFSNFENADRKKYEWVISIANSLVSIDQHKNVKIFLAKLIDNCRDVFSHYAEFLLEPILRILTDGSLGFEGINFFITDLVTMLLSWCKIYKPTKLEERESAGMLLKFLMQNAYHERNEIFKLNLELIKRMVENWNEVLSGKLPTQLLLDLLLHKETQKLICGIQLNGVILSNNLKPWNNNQQCEEFIKALLLSFNNENSKVYNPGSQLMGMFLQASNNEEFINIVRKRLEKFESSREKSEKFLQLLYGIQKNFPSILDTYMVRVVQSIPLAIRKIKCIYLEMFLSRMEIYKNNIYRELTVIELRDLLKQTEYQILALHILNKGIDFFTAREFFNFYNDLCYLVTSTNSYVRSIIYEIMIYSIEKFNNDETFDKKKPLKIILKGFQDTDTEIQNRVITFFNQNSGLSEKILERFDELLCSYYDPNLEKEFLHYSTQLLLEISIKHRQSTRKLLDYDQRNDINFFEIPINTKSTHSQRMLPPMFISSQQRQLLSGDGSQYSQMIRATQLNSNDYRMFEPTQDLNIIEHFPKTFKFSQTQNSLFISLKPQYLTRRSSFTFQDDDADNLQLQIQRNKEERSNINSLDYLRKRIVKRSDDQKSKDYALKAVERRDFAEASKFNEITRSKQGSDVVLYRRYRVGDYPDFFFTSLAILLPLQALVKKDIVIARHVFISIFTALISMFQERDDLENEANFYTSVNNSVLNILKESKELNSYFLATLIEMVIKSDKYLEILPSMLNDSLTITGILFIESQINHLIQFFINHGNVETSSKRLRLDENDIKLQHWIRLFDFYHKRNELEVINGILTDHLNLNNEIKILLLRAIKCESNNSFKDAMKMYSELLTKNLARNNSEKELYYNSYFNCLANLNDWDVITETAQSQFDAYEEIWNENIPFYQNTILPMLLKGELRKIIDGDSNDGFLSVIEDWLSDETKSEYLLKKFPEEIAMLNVIDENFTACCVEVNNVLHTLSEEWSYLEMFEDKTKLLNLSRNMAEISNFVNIMAATSVNEYIEKQAEKIYQSWKISLPKSSDSLVLWNDLIAYRKAFLGLAQAKFDIDDDQRQLFESFIIDTERNLLDVSFAQKNIDTAKVLIGKLHSEIQNSSNESRLKYNLVLGKYIVMLAEKETLENFAKAIKRYGNAWDNFKDGILNDDYAKDFPEIKISALCCISQISLELIKLSRKFDNDIIATLKDGFMQLMDLIDEDAEMIPSFIQYSERTLFDAKNLAQNILDSDYNPDKEILLGNIHYKLAKYYHFLFSETISKTQYIQLEMIKSVFRAISYEQNDAKIYIPYIISQLPDLYENKISEEFNEQIDMVPEWIFIPYISHIISNFNFENDCYLDKLVVNLAKKYPNALYYAFNLTRDHFQSMNDGQILEKPLVHDILEMISNPVIDRFTAALQCLVIPEKMVEIHFQNFFDNLREQMNNQKYQEAVQNLYDKIFNQYEDLKGIEFRKNIEHLRSKILDLQKLNWERERKKASMNIEELKKSISDSLKKKSISTIELNKLCNWLAEYKWSGNMDFIEIPGQYDGNFKPFIENHAKVIRFEPRLNVFSSKQFPIEFKIFGSDGRTYSFIVKHGEDLRQDQRIQEVLNLMSSKLKMNKDCKRNRLKIDTYQVVPINIMSGLLQMVTNVNTINEFMRKAAKPFMKKGFNEHIAQNRTILRNQLLGNEKFDGIVDLYEKALQNERSRLVEIYNECNSVPNNIIQTTLRGLSLTLNSYYVLRKNFITSLSTMNIAQWLLGIGDRHLDNILINMSNSRLIAIDFGIAFGTGATLAVPELIPFRLTQHFVGVLQPMGINGMIKENMTHALKCFRDHKEIILIFLEVFIKEPTLDWLKLSKIRKDTSDSVSEKDSFISSIWDPESRVNVVKRKFDGTNPMKLLIEELRSGHVKSKINLLNAYIKLIYGEEGSIRNKFKNEDEHFREEDQIECLIELATDKAILATTYLGWDSWF